VIRISKLVLVGRRKEVSIASTAKVPLPCIGTVVSSCRPPIHSATRRWAHAVVDATKPASREPNLQHRLLSPTSRFGEAGQGSGSSGAKDSCAAMRRVLFPGLSDGGLSE